MQTVLQIEDLLELGGSAVEEAQKKVEELEGDMHKKERQDEASLTYLRAKVLSLHGRLEQAVLKL